LDREREREREREILQRPSAHRSLLPHELPKKVQVLAAEAFLKGIEKGVGRPSGDLAR
jgi:hypothetical protein